MKNLTDEPGDLRKVHSKHIPTLGGVIIFAGTLFSITLLVPTLVATYPSGLHVALSDINYLIAALLILFFIGIKDDIVGTAPIYKLLGHILVGMILVLMADIRITGFHGLFGIHEIPYWASAFLSVFTFVVVVNAFNFIDGLDGLATGIGFIGSICFGIWFALSGAPAMAAVGFALAGSLLAFLIYNFSPAKIFMGDSGSLFVGLILCTLGIKLIEFDSSQIPTYLVTISRPLFVMGLFAYPLMDMLRIVIIRTMKGVSPLSADRNHIHHALIDINLGHGKSSGLLYLYTIAVVGMVFLVSGLNPTVSFLLVGGFAILTLQIPVFLKYRQRRSKAGIMKEMEHHHAM
ncbi:MAG TPA: MraY family glycosyltransferase [Bacteroidia bacterium]|nr:MraY family glycosyltransferase [Bacteroidia bacterium]